MQQQSVSHTWAIPTNWQTCKVQEKFLVIFLVMEQIFNLLSCTEVSFTGDLLGSGTDG